MKQTINLYRLFKSPKPEKAALCYRIVKCEWKSVSTKKFQINLNLKADVQETEQNQSILTHFTCQRQKRLKNVPKQTWS